MLLALVGPPFPIKSKFKVLESGVNEGGGRRAVNHTMLYARHFRLYTFGRADP